MWDMSDETNDEVIWETPDLDRVDREIRAITKGYEMVGRLSLRVRNMEESVGQAMGKVLLGALEEEVVKRPVNLDRLELAVWISEHWWDQTGYGL